MAAVSLSWILISQAFRSRQVVASEPSTRSASLPETGAESLTTFAPSETHMFFAIFTGKGAPGVGLMVKAGTGLVCSLSPSALVAETL